MPELGRAALVAALGLILYAAVAGGYAAWRGRRRLLDSAVNALYASFAAVGVASLVLLAALAANDFSFDYVARSTSRELPLGYTLAAFWSGQEGSLLLWLLVLTGAASAAVALNRRLVREVLPWTVPIVAGVALFFAFLLVAIASPFATQAAPTDGAGMNPSLQNPYMIAHPPMLYLGYVGLTIPFAFAMAALASRRVDERWIVVTRRWTLAAWTLLGVGILLGAKWAYEEVGWGGWYAWDPVENAALMPWLVATAFLHSVMVQEKKNMLRVWNVILVAGAFALSLFGTFLTRSGVISSIHSFTQSSIGPFFLGFIAVVVAASIALILLRLPLLRSPTRLESLVSREAAFLYNNLFLIALALPILWGSSTRSSPRRCAASPSRSGRRTTTSSRSSSAFPSCSSWGSARSSPGGAPRFARSPPSSPGRLASRSSPACCSCSGEPGRARPAWSATPSPRSC